MRCIRVERAGGPEVLTRQDVPVPEPGEGEVLVRVRHAGINFMDVHTRQGKYAHSRTYAVRLPCTLGMEGAGMVVRASPGVDGFVARPGARVAWCLAWGSYAEYASVPAARLAPVPDGLALDQAAVSIFPGLTAHYLANEFGDLGPGRSCLVHAASGVIGQLLVQMLVGRGATVYATTSTAEKAAVARAAGASQVFDYADFAAAVRAATGGRGVDVVFDAVGRDTLRQSFAATRLRGLVVNYGAVSGALRDLDPLELGEAGSLFLTRPRLADHVADAATFRTRAAAVFESLREGRLRLPIAARYTLDNVERAHAALEERRAVGKAVLDLPA
jgi:NADPH2:quinone reductase